MSIWSSFAEIEPLREGGYGADIDPDSWLDLADTGIRGTRGDLLRVVLWCDKAEASAVLDRQQAIALRDHLTAWLHRTPSVAADASGAGPTDTQEETVTDDDDLLARADQWVAAVPADWAGASLVRDLRAEVARLQTELAEAKAQIPGIAKLARFLNTYDASGAGPTDTTEGP